MIILILEDTIEKFNEIKECIVKLHSDVEIVEVVDWESYIKVINSRKFDLIIADLVVPRFKGEIKTIDVAQMLVDEAMDIHCQNLYTPIIALTQYGDIEAFKNLNNKKIIVLSYSESSNWRNTLSEIVNDNTPKPDYNFVVVCALTKEAKGFTDAGYDIGDVEIINGLECQKIKIEDRNGVIVTCPRMGLVNASITSTRAIEYFKPNLICMSGICAGIEGKVKIYDVVIPEICHQHDFGKWGSDGFEPEAYSVQLRNGTRAKIKRLIQTPSFVKIITDDLSPRRSEFPPNTEALEPSILLAPASSGSAVIADENMNEIVKNQHRKMSAFEMESFSVYESARLADFEIDYFSAKCVVDDGSINKSDDYHRIACIISAKTVYEIIKNCY